MQRAECFVWRKMGRLQCNGGNLHDHDGSLLRMRAYSVSIFISLYAARKDFLGRVRRSERKEETRKARVFFSYTLYFDGWKTDEDKGKIVNLEPFWEWAITDIGSPFAEIRSFPTRFLHDLLLLEIFNCAFYRLKVANSLLFCSSSS
jgi:hypothetical protein